MGVFSISLAQENTFTFTDTHYDPDGSIHRTIEKTITSPVSKTGLEFYKKNFHIAKTLPEILLNNEYQNDTIVILYDNNKPNDFRENWSNTCIYDSHHRLVSYSFSGCLVCSLAKFNYSIHYNDLGQVSSINNSLGAKDAFEMTWDGSDNITRVQIFHFGHLTRDITRK